MKPIECSDMGGRPVVFAEHQAEYFPLPAVIDDDSGEIGTRWQLDEIERRAIMDGACIEFFVTTFGGPLQPMLLRVQGVEAEAISDGAPAS